MVKEADRIVDRHLQQDQDVFRRLLTTEEFFVYHDKDNETGRKVIKEWTEVYHYFKDKDWKANPEKVIEDNLDYLKTKICARLGREVKRDSCATCISGETSARGTPFTRHRLRTVLLQPLGVPSLPPAKPFPLRRRGK